jgi:hypothetical protein
MGPKVLPETRIEMTILRSVMSQQSGDLIHLMLFSQVSRASRVMTIPDIAAEPCDMWEKP